MSNNVCVLYADIVGWSKQNTGEQVASATELFIHLKKRIVAQGLKIMWRASTGDGFAIAFTRSDGGRVFALSHDLLDQYVRHEKTQLRLGLAEGSIESFHNPLTNANDATGPAMIKARRILEGITDGSTLLVQKDFAEDLKKSLPQVHLPYMVPRPAITDKHGDTHEVVQVLPTHLAWERGGRSVPPTLEQLFRAAKSTGFCSTEAAIGDALCATDKLIILWMDDDNRGLEAAAVRVEPDLRRESGNLPDLSPKFVELAGPYLEKAKCTYGPPNNPKLWLKGLRSPLSDRPTLELNVGRTDYWTTHALELAYNEGHLRSSFEQKTFDIYQDTPGLLFVATFIVTSDGKLIFSQRKGRDVDCASGMYSPSFEEQWNPTFDHTPYETVLRGLSEEFNLDPTHNVHVSMDNVRLFAVAREWGALWNTALLFQVRLPASAAKVMNCWSSLPPPKDKNEHTGLCAVSLDSKTTQLLVSLIEGPGMVRGDELKRLCDGDFSGVLSDGLLHPTSGKMRILLALYAMNVLRV